MLFSKTNYWLSATATPFGLFFSAAAVAQTYPPDTTLRSYATPTLARPEYLTPTIDPTFNTTVVRIADQSGFNTAQLNLRHGYSKTSAWNSDGTKIALTSVFPTPILNGINYELIYKTSSIPTNPRWSNTDPNIMYGIDFGTNKFVTWNVNTQIKTVLHDFNQYDAGTLSIGLGEGSTSNSDRYVVLMAKSGSLNYVVSYDLVSDIILSELNTGTEAPNNATISQHGEYAVVQWRTNGVGAMQGTDVYDRNLVFQRKLSAAVSHYDLGVDVSGNEVMVYHATDANRRKPYMFRLSDGFATDLLGTTSNIMAPNYHVSCRNILRPGWAYYSSFDGANGANLPGRDQVWAVKLDGSGTVQVFAHVHHASSAVFSAQAHAVPDQKGERVIFASEWNGDPSNGPIYSYVARQSARGSDPATSPVIAWQPVSQAVAAGSTVVFNSSATNAERYQWQRNGVNIPNEVFSTLVIDHASSTNEGTYRCFVANASAGVTSNAAELTVLDEALSSVGRLINLSSITSLRSAGDTFSLGYVVGGSGTSGALPLVLRAAGPSLGALGIASPLADPKIEVFAGATKTGENDNWGGIPVLEDAMRVAGAFPFNGAASLDSATLVSSTTRDNSVRISSTNKGTGTVIAEIYDATPAASRTATTLRLLNVSILRYVDANTSLTTGFVLQGQTARTVLVRAIGPGLHAAFGVSDTMADPQLTLFGANATKIGVNDNWGGETPLRVVSAAVGAFAIQNSASRDAMLLMTLAPGAYTAEVKGSGGGNVIVEVYEVP